MQNVQRSPTFKLRTLSFDEEISADTTHSSIQPDANASSAKPTVPNARGASSTSATEPLQSSSVRSRQKLNEFKGLNRAGTATVQKSIRQGRNSVEDATNIQPANHAGNRTGSGVENLLSNFSGFALTDRDESHSPIRTEGTSPRTPIKTIIRLGTVAQSPSQNRSFSRIYKTLIALGLPEFPLNQREATTRIEEGKSVYFKLKSERKRTTQEIEAKLSEAHMKWDRLKPSAKKKQSDKGINEPVRAMFEKEKVILMDIKLQLHFGRGIHSTTNVANKGSYVKVIGWYLDSEGARQKAEGRAGRYGNFAANQTVDGKNIVIDRRKEEENLALPRQMVIANSPARAGNLGLNLLALVILDPAVATSDLSEKAVSRLVDQKRQASTTCGESLETKLDCSAFDNVMKALRPLLDSVNDHGQANDDHHGRRVASQKNVTF